MPITRLLAAVAVLIGTVAVTPGGAAAAITVDRIAGNFVGDSKSEIFEYRPGSGQDFLDVFSLAPDGTVLATQYPFTITGTYVPFAGDFDGDGHDELFLYGAGTAPDHIWDFQSLTQVVPMGVEIGGIYLPMVGDFTADGAEDIIWYAPGAVPEAFWEFDPNPAPVVKVLAGNPVNITGDYVPMTGKFSADGTDDVVLYGRGATPDHLVNFAPGSPTPVIGQFESITGADHDPFSLDATSDGRTDIFFYNAGSAPDPFWQIQPSGIWKFTMEVNGTYEPATGDFFGDGREDIFWFGTGSTSVWDWVPDQPPHRPVVRGFGAAS